MYKIKIQIGNNIPGFIGDFSSIQACLAYWRDKVSNKGSVWGCWIVDVNNSIVRTIV